MAEGSSLVNLLIAAACTGDHESSALLEQRLEGFEHWYAVKSGTAGRPMGQAAILRNDLTRARECLAAAIETSKAVRDRTELAKCRFIVARLLLEHFPEDRTEATEHLNYAVQEFGAMKMKSWLEQAMRLKLQFQGHISTDINTSIDVVARGVQDERPDLRQHAAPDGTVTLLFSDIEGSTILADRLGDNRFMDILREHNAIVREKVRKFSGFEVKSEGDGFMVAFQSARRAIDCAAAIQIALEERNETADEPIRVRMGLHAGEVIRDQSDFFGKNVILEARIAAQANGAEVLVSSVMKALVESAGDIEFGEEHEVELKGFAGKHRIHELIWAPACVVPTEGQAPAEPETIAAPTAGPPVLFCKAEDSVSIAYTTYGSGPPIIFIPYFCESFSMQGLVPEEQQFYQHLARGPAHHPLRRARHRPLPARR